MKPWLLVSLGPAPGLAASPSGSSLAKKSQIGSAWSAFHDVWVADKIGGFGVERDEGGRGSNVTRVHMIMRTISRIVRFRKRFKCSCDLFKALRTRSETAWFQSRVNFHLTDQLIKI